MTTEHQLVATYLRYFETKQDEDFWAWEQVDALVRNDPDQAWEMVRNLIEHTTSDEALAYVAAGPLEDLLKKYGPIFIDRTEVESRKSIRFRLALSGIWLQPSDPIYKRWRALIAKYGVGYGGRRGPDFADD
ncbi:MAG: DUF6869 domain-containing protein [Terriglobales bacterium]